MLCKDLQKIFMSTEHALQIIEKVKTKAKGDNAKPTLV